MKTILEMTLANDMLLNVKFNGLTYAKFRYWSFADLVMNEDLGTAGHEHPARHIRITKITNGYRVSTSQDKAVILPPYRSYVPVLTLLHSARRELDFIEFSILKEGAERRSLCWEERS